MSWFRQFGQRVVLFVFSQLAVPAASLHGAPAQRTVVGMRHPLLHPPAIHAFDVEAVSVRAELRERVFLELVVANQAMWIPGLYALGGRFFTSYGRRRDGRQSTVQAAQKLTCFVHLL
jgi:hypothetical protein